MIKIEQLNLNLLRVLNTLLNERNVNLASNKLHRTQPAISSSLKQLREIFQDPLLLPSQDGLMRLTEKAEILKKQISSIMLEINGLFSDIDNIKPENIDMSMSIGIQEHVETAVIDQLYQQINALVPNVKLNFYRVVELKALSSRQLQNLNFIIGTFLEIPNGFKRKVCSSDSYSCLSGNKQLNQQTKLSIADLESYDHVVVSYSLNIAQSIIETALKDLGIQRQYKILVSNANIAARIAFKYGLLLILASNQAQYLSEPMGLKIFKLPFKIPKFDIHLLYRDLTFRPQEKWFMENILEAALSRVP